MNTQDLIAIATFALAVLGVVYAFGKRDAKLTGLEKDLNGLGQKVERLDVRVDNLSTFSARVDQRVAHLQEEVLGEQMNERLRESVPDQHYTTLTEEYFSPNSGIEL